MAGSAARKVKMAYQGILLSDCPSAKELSQAANDYEAIVIETMKHIVDRYNRSPDYGWIDTRFSLISGKDFPKENSLKGRNSISGWIQGRGTEAMVKHAQWLKHNRTDPDSLALAGQLDTIICKVVARLRSFRQRNNGHLFFFMTLDGDPFMLDAQGTPTPVTLDRKSPCNFSDAFCAKGMYAAALYLNQRRLIAEMEKYCLEVDHAIWNGCFKSDQQTLDPKNQIKHIAGRHSQAPRMIHVSTCTKLVMGKKSPDAVDRGLKTINYILGNHANLNGKWPQLQKNDFVEYIDANGNPYLENSDTIYADPGHALELVGLIHEFNAACTETRAATKEQLNEIVRVESHLAGLLEQNFLYAFQSNPGGICKSYDLVARQPINDDMPWWSLPETMRAALGCLQIAKSDHERDRCLQIYRKSHNAFVRNYVRPDLHLMAVQTLAKDGSVVDVIPATPDVDPGYHTGLCLLRCIADIRKIST